MKITHSAALDIALNLLRIDIWIKKYDAVTLSRIQSLDLLNRNVFSYTGHLRVLGEIKGTTAHMPLDSKIADFSFTKAFNIIETSPY